MDVNCECCMSYFRSESVAAKLNDCWKHVCVRLSFSFFYLFFIFFALYVFPVYNFTIAKVLACGRQQHRGARLCCGSVIMIASSGVLVTKQLELLVLHVPYFLVYCWYVICLDSWTKCCFIVTSLHVKETITASVISRQGRGTPKKVNTFTIIQSIAVRPDVCISVVP